MKKIFTRLFLIAAFLMNAAAHAQIITTVAGNSSGAYGFSGDGGPATAAIMNNPWGIAEDPAGNLYIADSYNQCIRKIDVYGTMSTIAGYPTVAGYYGDGGPAVGAELNSPIDVSCDAAGNIYICDYGNNCIRKINTAGIISTVAGGRVSGFSGDGGPATDAGISGPYSVYADGPGNLFVVDYGAARVRKINTAGIITTVAGNGCGGCGGDGYPATATSLDGPFKAITDAAGNMYITLSSANIVYKVNTSGIVSTAAGTYLTYGYSGDGGPATDAGIYYPLGLALDPQNNLYIADASDFRIRKINTSGIISTYAGTSYGYSGDGGPATAAQFYRIFGLSIDNRRNLYMADGEWNAIRKVIMATTNPYFVEGHQYHLQVCKNSTAVSINPYLAVYDTSTGHTDTWSRLTTPAHGTASAAYSTTSSHSTRTPVGCTYTPTTGYTGPDSFNVRITNGISSDTITIYLNVIAPGAGSITGAASVCVDESTILADTTGTGVWNSTYGNVDVYNGFVIGITAGTDIITYSVTNTCGSYLTTKTITVIPLPVIDTIIGPSIVCAGATLALADSTHGGVWSISNPDATISVGGIVTGVSPGTDTIYYTVTGVCGPIWTGSIIEVTPSIVTGPISGTTTVCAGAATTLTVPDTAGTWTSSNTLVAIVGTAGNVTGIGAGTAVITYTYPTSCGTETTIKSVTVNPLPSPGSITGSATVCAGSSTTYSDGVTGGSWSSGSTGVATAGTTGIVTGVSAGTALISYTVTNSCGAAVAVKAITVNPLPVAGAITGVDSVCVGATTALTDPAGSGVWSSGLTAVATVGTSGTVTGVMAGTAIISYTVTNSCGTAFAVYPVKVNPLPVAGTITGTTTVCVDATTTLGDLAANGTWSSAATGIATVGSSGIVNGVSAGTALISYTVINSCGTAIATTNVTVRPLPLAGAVTGTTVVCVDATVHLADTATGGIWSSAATGTATVGTTGIVSGVAAGTVVISYAVSNSCGTAIANSTVLVNPLPIAGTIVGISTVCVADSISLSDAATGGVWSSRSGSIASVSVSGTVTGVAAGTSVITYSVTNSCGTAVAGLTVTVNPLADPGTITGIGFVCPGQLDTLSDTVTTGVWGSTNGLASVSGIGVVTGGSPGLDTILYSVTNSCGTLNADFSVIILPDSLCGFTGVSNPVAAPTTLTVYPNPNQGTFTLVVNTIQNEIAHVQVTNLVGETVEEFTVTTNTTNAIKLASAAGVYFIEVTTPEGRFVNKVAVEK